MSSATSALTSSLYASAAQTGTRPDTVTADAFARWPAAAQASLVRSFGTGNPLAILVGQGGQRVIATLNETGTDVDVVQAPADLDTTPANLTRAAFERWPGAAQIFYVRTNGSGLPRSVDLGDPKAGGVTATLAEAYGLANGVTLTDWGEPSAAEKALIDTPVAGLEPADFFTLSPDDQYAYFTANGTPAFNPSNPAASVLKLAPSADPAAARITVTLTSNGRPFKVEMPAAAFPGFGDDLFGTKIRYRSFVRASVFESWPREIQRAYVESKFTPATDPDTADGYRTEAHPKIVVFARSSSVASIASIAAPGAEVEMADLPADFDTTASGGLTVNTFLSWSSTVQLFFARSRYDTSGQASFTLPDSGPPTLTVALAPGRDGLALTSAGTRADRLAIDPASLDLDLFQLWPLEDQRAYLDAKGGGTRKSLLAGGGAFLLSLGPDAVPRIESVPAGFTTKPADLAPATFLGWSPVMRAAYLDQPSLAGVTETTVVDSGGRNLTQRSATVGTAPGPILTATRTPAGDAVTTGSFLAIDPTRGMGQPVPTANLYGSAGGLDPEPNASSADLLFTGLDGTAGRTIADKPDKVAAQFAKAPGDLTPAEFGAWHSGIQLEYLRKHGTAAQGYAVVIGPGSDPRQTTTAFISTKGDAVYTVESLKKTDIGKMSAADQAVLVTLPAFTRPETGLAAALDLKGNRTTELAVIDTLIKQIRSGDPSLKGGSSGMLFDDREVFATQLEILREKVASSAILSESSIKEQREDIRARFERANAFATAIRLANVDTGHVTFNNGSDIYLAFNYNDNGVTKRARVIDPKGGTLTLFEFLERNFGRPDQSLANRADFVKTFDPALTVKLADENGKPLSSTVTIQSLTAPVNVINPPTLSTDNNGALRESYGKLMDQERQILSLARSRASLAQTGKLENGTQHLDVPNLVYLFQLQANLTGEAKLRADTEELNQINALVKLYGVMQDAVNQVLKSNASSTKGNISLGKNAEQTKADTFFRNSSPHPIELIYSNISHPAANLDDKPYESWSRLGTQLAERVTLINQESQIRMNAINSSTKAKDRNFDLANNALTKMNEIVQKIAGAM